MNRDFWHPRWQRWQRWQRCPSMALQCEHAFGIWHSAFDIRHSALLDVSWQTGQFSALQKVCDQFLLWAWRFCWHPYGNRNLAIAFTSQLTLTQSGNSAPDCQFSSLINLTRLHSSQLTKRPTNWPTNRPT